MVGDPFLMVSNAYQNLSYSPNPISFIIKVTKETKKKKHSAWNFASKCNYCVSEVLKFCVILLPFIPFSKCTGVYACA